jgi:hypothetical protein
MTGRFSGYPKHMEELLSSNEGLASRFPRTLTFSDYSDEDLTAILTNLLESSQVGGRPGCQGSPLCPSSSSSLPLFFISFVLAYRPSCAPLLSGLYRSLCFCSPP